MSSIEHSSTPDAAFRFFVYCPYDGDFTYYRTADDRDQGAQMVIQRYLDDGWDEMVAQVVAGEVTHVCVQVGREDRPAEAELDAEQCDRDGKHWGEWDYTCNYDLIALPAAPDSVVTLVMAEGYEAAAHQGIPGTSFQALNAKANAGDL